MSEETKALPPHWLDDLYVEDSTVEDTLKRLIECDGLKSAVDKGIGDESEPRDPKKPGPAPGQKLRQAIQEAICQ